MNYLNNHITLHHNGDFFLGLSLMEEVNLGNYLEGQFLGTKTTIEGPDGIIDVFGFKLTFSGNYKEKVTAYFLIWSGLVDERILEYVQTESKVVITSQEHTPVIRKHK